MSKNQEGALKIAQDILSDKENRPDIDTVMLSQEVVAQAQTIAEQTAKLDAVRELAETQSFIQNAHLLDILDAPGEYLKLDWRSAALLWQREICTALGIGLSDRATVLAAIAELLDAPTKPKEARNGDE